MMLPKHADMMVGLSTPEHMNPAPDVTTTRADSLYLESSAYALILFDIALYGVNVLVVVVVVVEVVDWYLVHREEIG